MKLIGLERDARTSKVLVVASLAGVREELEVEYVRVGKMKAGVSLTGKYPVLYEGPTQVAFSSTAIALLLAERSAKAELLLGAQAAPMARAQVLQWVGYGAETLEHQCEMACLTAESGVVGKALPAKQLPAVVKAGLQALVKELEKVLERHLATCTFLVGDALSLADVALASALLGPMTKVLEPKTRQGRLPNVTRWFETVKQQAGFEAALGGEPLPLFAGGAAVAKAKAKASKAKKETLAAAAAAPLLSSASLAAAGGASPPTVTVAPLFQRSRTLVRDVVYASKQGVEFVGRTVVVCGWARTVRSAAKGTMCFMEINDGSCLESMQVVCSKADTDGFDAVMAAGGISSSHRVVGEIIESPAKGQSVELKASSVEVLGAIDADAYPLKKTGKGTKGHSVEFLREQAHLRARTNLVSCVARVRNACAHGMHEFFRSKSFLYVHTPLITASDCEGAGEMFAVTTLLGAAEKNQGRLPLTPEGKVDYKQDFFDKPAFLTVSGQLNVETYACALSDVYTFGPTFRAENSNTTRHLAEFWMVEPELCFATLKDDIDLAEEMVKFCTQYVLTTCPSEIAFFDERVEVGLKNRLANVLETPFKRLTYTEAIDVLNQPEHLFTDAAGKEPRFEDHPAWGIDLKSEHERYLCEKVYNGPVVLTDYPADIKAFYMRQNELDDKGRLTVQAMDILVPRIGELAGGSAREERLDLLTKRIVDMKLDPADFEWYCDLRRFGTVPHAGFGIGFERFVMFVTGVANIRDSIPFPRYPGTCAF